MEGAIGAPRQKTLTVRTPGANADRIVGFLKREEARSGGCVPDLEGGVVGGRQEVLAVRAPRACHDRVGVAVEAGEAGAGSGIPHSEGSTDGEQALAVRAPRAPHEPAPLVLARGEGVEKVSRSRVPHLEQVVGPRREALAVRAPRARADPIPPFAEGAETGAGSGVPHLECGDIGVGIIGVVHGVAGGGRQDALSIRTPCTGADHAFMAGEGEEAGAGRGVPHLEGTIRGA